MDDLPPRDPALDQRLSDAFANPKAGKAAPRETTLEELMSGPSVGHGDGLDQTLSDAFDNPKAGKTVATEAEPVIAASAPMLAPEDLPEEARFALERDLSEAFANPKAGEPEAVERKLPGGASADLSWAPTDYSDGPKARMPMKLIFGMLGLVIFVLVGQAMLGSS